MKEFKTIEIYHPETGRWTQKLDMPTSKSGHTAEVIKAKIYIFNNADPDDAPFATAEGLRPWRISREHRSNRKTSQNMGKP